MSEANENQADESKGSIGWVISLCVAVAAMIGCSLMGPAWHLGFLAAQIAVISIVIAQACDPFADAAQYIGIKLHLPGSVRGATLDAIASSMPELFAGLFFVLLAISAADGADEAALAGAEGFGSTIATCAGSAVYNMILIPAFCALFIAWYRKDRPTIEVEDEVIARDGVWFVACELIMILFLFQDVMYWWMGIVFLGMYLVYVLQLAADARKWRIRMELTKVFVSKQERQADPGAIMQHLYEQGHRVSSNFAARALERLNDDEDDNGDEDDSAGILFGYFDIPLNNRAAWTIIAVTTLIVAGACYFLVESTRDIAQTLSVPTFFVAVIVAAAASSVPDTLIAIGAAMRGDDSGAVSNAFGSNIFDICICLSIPLLVNSWLTGWQPVSMLQNGEPVPGLVGLRILLVLLTVVTLAIMWHNRELTQRKAWILCGLYGVFICYAVMGSLGIEFL